MKNTCLPQGYNKEIITQDVTDPLNRQGLHQLFLQIKNDIPAAFI